MASGATTARPKDGTELTVQSLGIGGPSAAAVMSDLARLGVGRAIRIGSCIPLDAALEPGASLVATSFEPDDGAGFALSGGRQSSPDPALTDALLGALPGVERPARSARRTWLRRTLRAARRSPLDLSSAAFAAAGARDGVACACALVAIGPGSGGSRARAGGAGSALIGLGTQAARALEALAQASGS